MPIRARFLEPQPHVNVVHDKGFVYVFICLNEEQKVEEYEGAMVSYLEYDYHEFKEKESRINIEDVMKNPEKYLSYSAEKQEGQDIIARLEALERRALQEV